MNFIESGGKPFFEFLRRILTNFALFLRGLTDVVIILFESLSEILTVVAVEVGPWLAPFAPATLTFGHLLNDFGLMLFKAQPERQAQQPVRHIPSHRQAIRGAPIALSSRCAVQRHIVEHRVDILLLEVIDQACACRHIRQQDVIHMRVVGTFLGNDGAA